MSLLFIFLKGMLIGFSIAVPVGPIALLCMKTSLRYGGRAGMAVGAGAAFADTFYAVLGMFGVALVTAFVHMYTFWFRFVGGLLLLFLGGRTILAHFPKAGAGPDELPGVSGLTLFKNFTSSFFLTLTNPITVFAFIAVFAALGLNFDNHLFSVLIISGVFTGSLIWWFILSTAASHMKSKINATTVDKINMGAGVVISIFGILAFLSAFEIFFI